MLTADMNLNQLWFRDHRKKKSFLKTTLEKRAFIYQNQQDIKSFVTDWLINCEMMVNLWAAAARWADKLVSCSGFTWRLQPLTGPSVVSFLPSFLPASLLQVAVDVRKGAQSVQRSSLRRVKHWNTLSAQPFRYGTQALVYPSAWIDAFYSTLLESVRA